MDIFTMRIPTREKNLLRGGWCNDNGRSRLKKKKNGGPLSVQQITRIGIVIPLFLSLPPTISPPDQMDGRIYSSQVAKCFWKIRNSLRSRPSVCFRQRPAPRASSNCSIIRELFGCINRRGWKEVFKNLWIIIRSK